MSLYYIKAKVYIKVAGISGESQEGVSALVSESSVTNAKFKFEEYCRQKFSKMDFDGMRWEYLEIAPQI